MFFIDVGVLGVGYGGYLGLGKCICRGIGIL